MIEGRISFRFTWICTAIAFFCERSSVTGTRAFPASSQTVRQVRICGRSLIPAGGALFANPDEDDPDNRVPATGWNHNQPTDSSRFWQAPNGSSQKLRANGEDKETPKAARTGWLHNTKAKKEAQQPKAGGISKAQQRLQQAMVQQERNHRIVSPPTFHACGNERQIVVTEHRLSIPIFRPEKNPRIDLAFTIVEEIKDEASRKFFTELGSMSASQRASVYVEKAALKNADEMMVYLQGGPGFGSPTPVVGLGFAEDSSWGAKALGKYKRIVLMDQRGTGKSTPITKQSLEKRFPNLFVFDEKDGVDLESLSSSHPEEHKAFAEALTEATNYIAQFRADNIVLDAEYIREALMVSGEPSSVSCKVVEKDLCFCTETH